MVDRASAQRTAWSIQPQAHEAAKDAEFDLLKGTLASLREEWEDIAEEETEDRETMKVILQEYVNATDEYGRSALFLVCNQNCVWMALLLLSPPFHADPNLLDQDGYSPIYIPCERGFLGIVQLLIRFGANVNHQVLLEDEDEAEASPVPPLNQSIWNSSMSLGLPGLSTREDPHKGLPLVATPLLAAIQLEQVEIVQILLEQGANPNVVTDTIFGKKSALEISREVVPNRPIRKLLYDHGAVEQLLCQVISSS